MQPNISGDLGRMGRIPFGKQYANYSVVGYERDINNSEVEQIFVPDSCQYFSVLTIGDSFSQLYEKGYQTRLSALQNQTIGNTREVIRNPLQSFVSLLESGFLCPGQTVIVENVERSLVEHLNCIDFESKDDYEFRKREQNNHFTEECLSGFFSWIRLRLGFENPVTSFLLKKSVFSHPRFSSTLFILNEKKYRDGDLFWSSITENEYVSAKDNLARIERLAKDRGIRFFLLIAPDKYDIYEPWIKSRHKCNPTLLYFEDGGCVMNPKAFLQKQVIDGVKDVYLCNDTHWSEKGADLVAGFV